MLDPTLAGPVISTAGGLLGNFINNGFAAWNADNTNSQNLKIARETNAVNKDIADQNLALQKEWNEYQKALQQQIFEREDTSYQRTAHDMLAAGINPLSMQGTNGAGQVVSTSAPQNNFQAQQSSPMQQATFALDSMSTLMAGIGSIFEQYEKLATGKLQRDELQTQIDYQKLINSALERENKHKVDIGQYDTDMLPEKIITHLLDWTQHGRLGKSLNFDFKDLMNLFDPNKETDIPFINDIKEMLFGNTTAERLSDRINEYHETKAKNRAIKKSEKTKSNEHYQEKNKEYTERYSEKPSKSEQTKNNKHYQTKNEEYKQRYGGR